MSHPLVGVWKMEVAYTGRPLRQLAMSTFHEDGSLTIAAAGFAAQGVWTATAENQVRMVALAPVGPAEGQAAWHTFSAGIGLSPDGQSLTLQGSLSRPTPSGAANEIAATATGKRLRLP